MKKLKAILGVAVLGLFVTSCGSSNGTGNCDFDYSSITNGSNMNTANSYWACQGSQTLSAIQAFDSENGASITVENGQIVSATMFIFEEIACNEFDIDGYNDANQVIFHGEAYNFSGSRSTGTMSFTYKENGIEYDQACQIKFFN